jgi:hypothetical protein
MELCSSTFETNVNSKKLGRKKARERKVCKTILKRQKNVKSPFSGVTRENFMEEVEPKGG